VLDGRARPESEGFTKEYVVAARKETMRRSLMARKRYIVLHAGKGIGWVHAEHPMEAIKRVARMTGKPAEECAAVLFELRCRNSLDRTDPTSDSG
jgi:hypothetical protein